MANEFVWIYLVIFLAIPLARILPRVIRKLKNESTSEYSNKDTVQWRAQANPGESSTQGNDMLILGQMIAGAKTFESIQKYTNLSNKKLDSELQDLESKGMIKVESKQGLLGTRVEIYPTSKGIREFHN